MSTRLPTGLLIGALLRRVNDSGGFGAVLARGDAQGGAALLLLVDRSGGQRLVERGIGADGKLCLIDSTPPADLTGYWQRRRSNDPDLWVVELNTPDAERFAAETMLVDCHCCGAPEERTPCELALCRMRVRSVSVTQSGGCPDDRFADRVRGPTA